MSATIFLKHSMKRGTDAVINVSQHILIVFGLFTFIGFLNLFSGDTLANDILPTPGQSAEVSDLVMIEEALEAAAPGEGTISDILSPRMLGALDYVTRHYRVSQDALVPVFEIAQQIGQERQIDPLLIVAIIGRVSKLLSLLSGKGSVIFVCLRGGVGGLTDRKVRRIWIILLVDQAIMILD